MNTARTVFAVIAALVVGLLLVDLVRQLGFWLGALTLARARRPAHIETVPTTEGRTP